MTRKEVCRRYYVRHRAKILETAAKERKNNRGNRLRIESRYRERNRAKIQIRAAAFYAANPDKINRYAVTRYHKNPLLPRLRSRIWAFVQATGIQKNNTTRKMLGCSPTYLKKWLERRFSEGMTWENRGRWHVDHDIPLSLAKTESEMKLLCHFSNLRPLWAEENIKKHNRHRFGTRELALRAAEVARITADNILFAER